VGAVKPIYLVQLLTITSNSQLRSALLAAVPQGGDLPESVGDAVDEWTETEDLEGKL
jgi:hypothetical protein